MPSEIACLVVTNQITDEAMPWLKRAREIFGRLVIIIDQRRAHPDAEKRAKEVATAVFPSDSADFFGSDFKMMIQACESDWVFFLDHDEELSAEWSDPNWFSVLRTTEVTHYLFPRRWMLSRHTYIAAEPWWPDLQLRLFRTEAAVSFPTKPHQPVGVSGNSALLRHLTIHHHIWLLDQPARQEKTKFYDSLLPGGGLDYFYLYEQFHPRELPLPAPARFDPAHDVIAMPRLKAEDVGGVELEVRDLPGEVGRGKLFWSRAVIRNRTAAALASAPPFLFRLSYHWRDAVTGAIEIYDGLRSGFIDPIQPGEDRDLEFVVLTPARAGTFQLELTLVQEKNFWFDNVIPGFGKVFQIEVV